MLAQNHCKELLQSSISPELAALNFKSLEDETPFEYLLYGLSGKERRNDGRIRKKWLDKYTHTSKGGFWVSGIDVLTGEDSLWGQFKPDRPRKILGAKKVIKYEAPPRVSTGIFALRVHWELALAIAAKYGLSFEGQVYQDCQTNEAVGFWQWVIDTPQVPLIITEGAKKAACLLSAGYAAIALPGIYNGYRQPKDNYGNKIGAPALIPELQVFAVKDREVVFCFDNDLNPKTRRAVQLATVNTGNLFAKEGVRCKVMSWSHAHPKLKGVDDLIRETGCSGFFKHYEKAYDLSIYSNESLTSLAGLINHTLDRRYLELPPIDPQAQILGLKSAKGTGKTKAVEDLVKRYQREGRRILVLTHRIQLAKNLCNRLGIDHVDDFRKAETKGALGIGLCVDSLRAKSKARFDAEEWQGAIIVLDEIEQVLWHLLSSKTCERNRLEILANLQAVLQVAVQYGGKIIAADADLSAIAINFITQLLDFKPKIQIIDNIYKPVAGKRKVYSYGSPAAVVARVKDDLAQGKKAYLCLSAQKEESKWSTINLETEIGRYFKPDRILRIDAETISDPSHPAFGCIEYIDEVLKNYDCVLASPTIETGVSIELMNHFDAVYGVFAGVQTVDAAAQALERVRDDCDRHIFAATRGLNFVGRGETRLRHLLRTTHSYTQDNIKLLRNADLSDLDWDSVDLKYQQPSLLAWAKRAVIVNTGMKEYRQMLLDKLEREGYELYLADDSDPDATRQVNEDIKEIREIAYNEKKQAIATANDLSDTEAKTLEKRQAVTKQQLWELRKYKLKQIYGKEVNPELVEKDDKGWYKQLKLHYYLTIGNDYLNQRETISFERMLNDVELGGNKRKVMFKPDVNKKLILAKVQAMDLLGVRKLIDLKEGFSAEDLREFKETAWRFRFQIYNLYGIQVGSTTTPIKVLQGFLRQLGLTTVYQGRFTTPTGRQRTYKICDLNSDGRNDVFEYWLKRDQKLYATPVECPQTA